jgi:hypothetical protein
MLLVARGTRLNAATGVVFPRKRERQRDYRLPLGLERTCCQRRR